MSYEKAGYPVKDIANWFIRRNKIEEEDNGSERITLLKLLKLLYYAEGCSLALNNRSLFNDEIRAWEHGPVVPNVYYAYNSDSYNLPVDETTDFYSLFKKEDLDCLEKVFQVFGAYNAWALRDKTHKEKPWLEATFNGQKLNGIISRDTMKDYFEKNYIRED